MLRAPTRTDVQQHVLFVLLMVLLALRHLAIFYSVAEFPHFPQVMDALAQIDTGDPWVAGTAVWETRLQLGGPLYYWFYLPVRVFDDPVVGIHLYFFFIEAVVICAWLLWGPRVGLTRELTWCGALLLTASFTAKYIVCENMTVAVYLSVLLFLSTLWSVKRDRWGAAALTGLLLGAAVQVHVSTLCLALPVVAVLLSERQRRWQRLAALCAGWAAVLLISAWGVRAPDEQHTSYALQQLTTRYSLGNLVSRLALSGAWPLALLGLGLGGYTWYKDGARSAGLRLAVLWLVIPYVLLSAALAYMGGYQPHESRYAMLNPARAVLAGMALLWLFNKLNPTLQRWFDRKVEILDVLISTALLLVLVTAVDARRQWELFEQAAAAPAGQTCNCDFWRYRDLSRHFHRFERVVRQRGLPEALAGRPVKASTPNREETEALLYWMRGQRGTGEPLHMVVAPKLRGLDLSRIKGAKDYGDFFFAPGCLPAKVAARAGKGRYDVTLHPRTRPDSLVLVTLQGRDGFVPPRRVRAVAPGADAVGPAAGCDCPDPTDSYSYGGWMLFNHKVVPGVGRTFMLQIDHAAGELDSVQAYTLP